MTKYVCAKCGATTTDPEENGWLVASRKNHEYAMIIRCPQHITKYAIQQAELTAVGKATIRGGLQGVREVF